VSSVTITAAALIACAVPVIFVCFFVVFVVYNPAEWTKGCI